jgi:hypothetical protein
MHCVGFSMEESANPSLQKFVHCHLPSSGKKTTFKSMSTTEASVLSEDVSITGAIMSAMASEQTNGSPLTDPSFPFFSVMSMTEMIVLPPPLKKKGQWLSAHRVY